MDDNHLVVISGCSGGGKSTLLAELSRRGHMTIEEPGRRIVAEELRSLDYEVVLLPELSVSARADFILECLAMRSSGA